MEVYMNIKNRSIVKAIIFSIITCGIYSIYWAVVLTKDALSVRDTNDSGTLEIVLMILVPFVGSFLVERKLTEGCQARGIAHSDNSILYLILGFFGFALVSFAIMQNDLNNIAPQIIAAESEPVESNDAE